MVSMALQPVRGFTGLVIRSFEMEGRVRDVWVWYASILLAGLFTLNEGFFSVSAAVVVDDLATGAASGLFTVSSMLDRPL